MTKRAVLYCRVSRSAEESVSIERQEAELSELASAEGWPVVAVFKDDGISGRVEREKADAALDMLRDGLADVLLVWEMSRWSRVGLSVVSKLVEVLRSREGTLFWAKREGLRSDQPTFAIMAAVIAELARAEAEANRERVLSMRARVLSKTDPSAQRWLGGKAPMGYAAVARSALSGDDDQEKGPGKALAIDPYEAQHVREVARLITTGHSLTEATRYLNDAKVPTPQSPARRARQAGQPTEGLAGGLWRITTVRKMVQSPTLVGRTTRKVEVGKRDDGSPIIEHRVVTDDRGLPTQRWAPVLDAGTYAAVQELFRKRGPNQARKAASWLSGQLFCDLCHSVLYANSRKGRTVDSFRCANKNIPGHSCPGVSVSRQKAEDYMEGEILRMIGSLKEYKVETRREGNDTAALDDVALAIEDVQRAFAQNGADYPALSAQMAELAAERQRLLELPARTVTTRVPTGRTLADAWKDGGIPERQFILSDMLDGIRVYKARERGRASRIEDRLDPVWIEHPVEDD